MSKLGIFGQKLRFGHPIGEEIEDEGYPDAGPSYAGSAAANRRVDDYTIKKNVHHKPSAPRATEWGGRAPFAAGFSIQNQLRQLSAFVQAK
jgi:hypothetical protein